MFVDSSRLKDLAQLKVWMDDPQQSVARRKMFYRTFQKIRSQLHDKKLAIMRERLMRATRTQDKYEMWKITNQIKDYMKEERLEEGTF